MSLNSIAQKWLVLVDDLWTVLDLEAVWSGLHLPMFGKAVVWEEQPRSIAWPSMQPEFCADDQM